MLLCLATAVCACKRHHCAFIAGLERTRWVGTRSLSGYDAHCSSVQLMRRVILPGCPDFLWLYTMPNACQVKYVPHSVVNTVCTLPTAGVPKARSTLRTRAVPQVLVRLLLPRARSIARGSRFSERDRDVQLALCCWPSHCWHDRTRLEAHIEGIVLISLELSRVWTLRMRQGEHPRRNRSKKVCALSQLWSVL